MLAHLELGFYKYSRRGWNFLFFYIRNRFPFYFIYLLLFINLLRLYCKRKKTK
ncbi:hypothetical protein ACE6H2_010906 [Prunus campanulata]